MRLVAGAGWVTAAVGPRASASGAGDNLSLLVGLVIGGCEGVDEDADEDGGSGRLRWGFICGSGQLPAKDVQSLGGSCGGKK